MPAQTPVRFEATLRGYGREGRDPGPSWTVMIDARADGSPSLDALACYPAMLEAGDRDGTDKPVLRVMATWCGRPVGRWFSMLRPELFVLLSSDIRIGLARVGADQAVEA